MKHITMTMTADIECEIRSFLSDDDYGRAAGLLGTIGTYEGEDEQMTYYLKGNGDPDLRIQRNKTGSKIWMKKGRMHDAARQEIELPCRSEDFPTLEKLFLALGYAVSIKWFRKRRTYKVEDITATLDDTLGYGKILELEILCREDGRIEAMRRLEGMMTRLGISPTPKEDFDARYGDYERNWRALTGAG